MPLKNVIKQNWEILYYQHSESRCDIEDYLKELSEEDKAEALAKFDTLAEKGRDIRPTKVFHEAGEDIILNKGQKNEIKCKMYGLKQNRHRLYAILIEAKKQIIFTHGKLKKTQPTDKSDKKRFKEIVKRLNDEGELS